MDVLHCLSSGSSLKVQLQSDRLVKLEAVLSPNLMCEISDQVKITMWSPFSSFHDPKWMQRSKGQASKGELYHHRGLNQDCLFGYVFNPGLHFQTKST